MHERDFILRVIQQMGQVLIALRKRILGQEITQDGLHAELASVAERSGIDLDMIRAMTPETLRLLIAPTGEVEPGRCWMIAEMLYLEGLQAEVEERPDDAVESYQKALPLYRLLGPGALHLELKEAADRSAELTEKIRSLTES